MDGQGIKVKLISGVEFSAEKGSPILEAGELAGIRLPYSCRSGRCNTCKCKVISGVTKALYPETGLTAHERDEGWILSCVRSAVTDLSLEVEELNVGSMPTVRTLPCRIDNIEHFTPNTIKVRLRLPPKVKFNFIPGQYIEVIGLNGIRRSYSIANGPTAESALELHIRKVHGGVMSDYWFEDAQVNDLLRLNGPLGTCFLRETSGIDVVFLATGTGIAPIKSMLESLSNSDRDQVPKSVTVLWGGRSYQDLYMDFEDLCINHNHVHYIPVHSRPERSWSGAKGYVQDVLLELGMNLENVAVYACGSDAMIRSAKQRLLGSGLVPQRFYSDAFVSSGSD